MRRSYPALGLLALASALLTVFLARSRGPEGRVGTAAPPRSRIPLVLTLTPDGVRPDLAAVPKGSLVALSIRNETRSRASVTLSGYEDRVRSPGIGIDSVWTTTFVSDRPGEDFAWLRDGRPAGRLVVEGSHLEEGHE